MQLCILWYVEKGSKTHTHTHTHKKRLRKHQVFENQAFGFMNHNIKSKYEIK